MSYLSWDKKQISNLNEKEAEKMYASGFVLTRLPPYTFNQTRSLRIDLEQFENSSENRRILRKNETLKIFSEKIPYDTYGWQIGKMAKDFYETKFGKKIFSANKVKEILTGKGAFNTLLIYKLNDKIVGYSICFETPAILHYSYPFYDLNQSKNLGLGMMTLAINHAKENNKKFIYLGSFQRPSDTYKLQFKGLEFFEKETGWLKYPNYKPKL